MSSMSSTINTAKTNVDVAKTNSDVAKTNSDVAKTNVDAETPVNKKIFRFKLSDEVNDALSQFTSLYRYNERKELKENWSNWCEENSDIILTEERRLLNLGYTGNCLDKMFTSVRYYHIKKANKPDSRVKEDKSVETDDNDSSSKKKRKYFTLDKKFLAIIDDHIKDNMSNKNFKPAKSFSNFTETQKETIKKECLVFIATGLSEEDFNIKLKKTYKNRYFNIVK
jgi:hypothetical protein